MDHNTGITSQQTAHKKKQQRQQQPHQTHKHASTQIRARKQRTDAHTLYVGDTLRISKNSSESRPSSATASSTGTQDQKGGNHFVERHRQRRVLTKVQSLSSGRAYDVRQETCNAIASTDKRPKQTRQAQRHSFVLFRFISIHFTWFDSFSPITPAKVSR